MTAEGSWRERRRALLRDDPTAAANTRRLLEEMGTEDRDEAAIEADHRASLLAAAREWFPEDPVSTRADHGDELIPRPEQTPEALRAALAVVAPGRLPEMRRTKDEAFAEAVKWQSLGPVQSWVLAWARDIEIARRPDLSVRHARAKINLEHEHPAVARTALRELTAVLEEAMEAVRV